MDGVLTSAADRQMCSSLGDAEVWAPGLITLWRTLYMIPLTIGGEMLEVLIQWSALKHLTQTSEWPIHGCYACLI